MEEQKEDLTRLKNAFLNQYHVSKSSQTIKVKPTSNNIEKYKKIVAKVDLNEDIPTITPESADFPFKTSLVISIVCFVVIGVIFSFVLKKDNNLNSDKKANTGKANTEIMGRINATPTKTKNTEKSIDVNNIWFFDGKTRSTAKLPINIDSPEGKYLSFVFDSPINIVKNSFVAEINTNKDINVVFKDNSYSSNSQDPLTISADNYTDSKLIINAKDIDPSISSTINMYRITEIRIAFTSSDPIKITKTYIASK